MTLHPCLSTQTAVIVTDQATPAIIEAYALLLYHLSLAGVDIALPALSPSRRAAILDAVDSLASQLSTSSPVLALVLRFRLSLIACPQNFYPVEGADSAFLDEAKAAAWLRVKISLPSLSVI